MAAECGTVPVLIVLAAPVPPGRPFSLVVQVMVYASRRIARTVKDSIAASSASRRKSRHPPGLA